MSYHKHLTAGLALGALLLAAPAWADGGYRHGSGGSGHHKSRHGAYGHGHSHAGGHMLRHLFKHKQDLQLTEEQVSKLRTLALDADRAEIRADADVEVSRRELRSMLWDQQVQMSTIEAKVNEQKAFEAAARIIEIKARRDLLGVLNQEQRDKLKSLWHQRRQGHSRSMGAQAGEMAQADDAGEPEMESGDGEPAESAGESAAG